MLNVRMSVCLFVRSFVVAELRYLRIDFFQILTQHGIPVQLRFRSCYIFILRTCDR